MKRKKIRNIFIILDIFIVLLTLYFGIGYLNFNRIKNNKNPIYTCKKIENSNSKNIITVYKYGIYKIVRNETVNSNVSYNMKFWFQGDN